MPLQQKELLKYGGRNVILSTTKSQDSRVLAKLFHYSASLRFRPKFGRITKVGPGRLFLPSFPHFPFPHVHFLLPIPNIPSSFTPSKCRGKRKIMALKWVLNQLHISHLTSLQSDQKHILKKKYRSILNRNHACYGQGKYIPSVTKHGICYVGLRIVKENIYIYIYIYV